MLLNVYIATVIASFLVNITQYIAAQVKMSKLGYHYTGKLKKTLNQLPLLVKIILLLLYRSIYLILFVVFTCTPGLNLILTLKDLITWNKSINKYIFTLKMNDEIALNSYKETLKTGELSNLMKKNDDWITSEMIESMFFEGADVKRIKQELKNVDAEKKVEKEEDAVHFAKLMVDEVTLSMSLTPKEKQELLKKFKKAALSERETMSPIKASMLISLDDESTLSKKKY